VREFDISLQRKVASNLPNDVVVPDPKPEGFIAVGTMQNPGTLPLPKAEGASNPRAGQHALMSTSSCNICRRCAIKLTVLTQNPNPNLLKPCVSKS